MIDPIKNTLPSIFVWVCLPYSIRVVWMRFGHAMCGLKMKLMMVTLSYQFRCNNDGGKKGKSEEAGTPSEEERLRRQWGRAMRISEPIWR